MTHSCNAYCTGIEHCELVLTGPTDGDVETLRRQIDSVYAVNYGRRVARVEPAPEAPGLDAFRSADLHTLTLGPASDQERWLVWWS